MTASSAPPRLNAGLRQIAFFIVPSAMAFLALGDVIAAALFQTGRFTHAGRDVRLGHSRGLGGRTARVDARPAVLLDLLRAARHADAAAVRDRARRADHRLGLPVRDPAAALARHRPAWGAAGLTASAGIAGWVEFALLRRTLNRRIGTTGLPVSLTARLWTSAARGGGRLGREARARDPGPDLRRGGDSRSLRGCLLRAHVRTRHVDECARLLISRAPRALTGFSPSDPETPLRFPASPRPSARISGSRGGPP